MKSLVLRSSFVICTLCFILLLVSPFIGKALPTDRLLFLSNRDGASNLYTMDIHRGLTQKINDIELFSYVLSPDGEQILFLQPISDRAVAIFTMRLNGSDVHQLVEHPSVSPAWSPDSQYIVFIMYDENSTWTQVYRSKRDGGDLKALTQLADEYPFMPSWSPDGTHILFHATAAGNKVNTYMMNADGSDLQRVALLDEFEVFASLARWSPDNRYVAFAGSQDQNETDVLCVLESGINNFKCLENDVFNGSGFSWSPDSKKIAYVSSGWSGIFNLEIVDIETGEARRILRYSEITPFQIKWLGYPLWTDDGSALIYELSLSGRQFKTQLYIINADGSGERKLTDAIGGAYAAAWWPDD